MKKVTKKERNNILLQNPPEEELIKPENILIDSEITIYGELIKIGGDRDKIWIKINNKMLNFSINREHASELAPKLHKIIALKGKAKWNVNTKDIVNFKISEIVPFIPHNAREGFKKLREITSGFWDTFNTNEDITKYLRDE